jgi:hypothetical protein
VRLTLLQPATENSKEGKTKTEKKGSKKKKKPNKTQKQYEQQCKSHTCSGMLNSSMYD